MAAIPAQTTGLFGLNSTQYSVAVRKREGRAGFGHRRAAGTSVFTSIGDKIWTAPFLLPLQEK
jgi:hypothetical protein